MKERADSSSCDLGRGERAPAPRGQWAGERADAVDEMGAYISRDVQHMERATDPPLLREILIMF